ncbi:hypothetical protein SCUP234_02196 [Seiridium cupressi]
MTFRSRSRLRTTPLKPEYEQHEPSKGGEDGVTHRRNDSFWYDEYEKRLPEQQASIAPGWYQDGSAPPGPVLPVHERHSLSPAGSVAHHVREVLDVDCRRNSRRSYQRPPQEQIWPLEGDSDEHAGGAPPEAGQPCRVEDVVVHDADAVALQVVVQPYHDQQRGTRGNASEGRTEEKGRRDEYAQQGRRAFWRDPSGRDGAPRLVFFVFQNGLRHSLI